MDLILSEYNPVEKHERLHKTELQDLGNGYAKIFVGDSKEGWCQALDNYLMILSEKEYEHIHTIKINFNSVRPKGERLKTFGGTASGPEPLKEMFEGFDQVLKNQLDPSIPKWEEVGNGYVKIRPVGILDMGNLIGNNVVVGGVRRTAEINLFSANDFESMFAKYGINGLWSEEQFERHEEIKQKMIELEIPVPVWFDEVGTRHYDSSVNGEQPYNFGRPMHHRRMSNNSIAFDEKPSREFLHLVFLMMKNEGEPGFINMEEGRRRRPNFEGMNPCAEILLDKYQTCNLSTVNLTAFVEYKNGKYVLNERELIKAQKLSARVCLRMTLVELELYNWAEKQNRDRLLGTSLTGVQDAFAMLGYNDEQQAKLLKKLGKVARQEADRYAYELRVSAPLLVSTVKPEGTISQLMGGVSSGLHMSHSPIYIRRIRINADDPLAKVAMSLNWNVNPEVGSDWTNARTLVIDFPIQSGSTRTKDDVTALEQLDTYFMFQKNYTEHNSSNTITVRPHEWELLEDKIFERWDEFMAVSFLALDGGTYKLAPYEACDEKTYETLKAQMKPFDPALLEKFETVETDYDIGSEGCESGVCPIR